MTDRDISEMIQRCIEEITMLRERVATLQPRADAYAAIEKILGLLPGRELCAAPDFVWRLKKQLEELHPKVDVAHHEV